MPADKDCPQCKGSGLVADLPQFPKPAWEDYENRPRGGPDPMTDFVKPIPCPKCCPEGHDPSTGPDGTTPREPVEDPKIVPQLGPTAFVRSVAKDLRAKAVDYRRQADKIEGLAKIADGLTPGSDAEQALIDLLKTQGVEL